MTSFYQLFLIVKWYFELDYCWIIFGQISIRTSQKLLWDNFDLSSPASKTMAGSDFLDEHIVRNNCVKLTYWLINVVRITLSNAFENGYNLSDILLMT